MKKRETQPESSIKIALKVKAFERHPHMVMILDPNHVRLTDEKSKSSEDFDYDKIFDILQNNADVFDYARQSTVGRIFDNTNCCLICLGQAGSGKSYTLFGNDARLNMSSMTTDYTKTDKNVGLVQKVFNGLVESSLDFQDNKEYQIIFSMMEVHKEYVYDLLTGFEDLNKKEAGGPSHGYKQIEGKQSLENLEVYESANGQLMIKNLSTLHVDGEDELVHMLAYGIRMRNNNSKALGYNYPNSHIVMNMNFVLRDKENYNFPSLNATIQFVEIACHDRLSATLNDQKKFQDSLCQNAQIAALQKVISGINTNKKMLPYKESKLTKVMQNYCNANSEVVIINHAISNPNEFNACLSYMNLVDRFKSDRKEKGLAEEINRVAGEIKGDHVTNSLTAAEEKVVKKMKEDLRELDARFEYMKKEYRNNFLEIGNIIGAKENLEGLIYKKIASFWTEFREKKQTLLKIEAKDKTLNEKDMMIIKTQKKIEELKRELGEKLELHIVQTYQAQDEINYLRDQSKILANNRIEFERDTVSQRYDKVRQVVAHNQVLLSDKAVAVSKFPKELLKISETQKGNTTEAIKFQAYQSQKQKNEELLRKLREQNAALINAKKVELETMLKMKNKEADEFHQKCLEKKKRKKQLEKELENELIGLYTFLKKQSNVIYKIKNDAYNSGLETINIPTEDIDKLHLPVRETHPQFFRVMDKKKINETKAESKGTDKKDDTVASAMEDLKMTLNKSIQKTFDLKSPEDAIPAQTNHDLEKMDKKELTELAKKLQEQLEIQRTRIKTLNEKVEKDYQGGKITEIEALLNDKVYYEKKIAKQRLVGRQAKETIDSQQRLLAKELKHTV